MVMRFGWSILAACGLVCGCANGVQTSSGGSYLAARPEFRPPEGTSIERAVYDAANKEPLLRFPARIGLARVVRRHLTTIPPEEADKWLELIRDAGAVYGEFVPISPLVASITASSQAYVTDDVIDKIRIGAARQHVDAVLIYEVFENQDDRATVLSIADLTIIGSFLVPSRAIKGKATADAILIDVRNGYPYGTASSEAQETGFVVNSGSGEKAQTLADKAAIDAVGKLTVNVGKMVARVKSELDSKELAKLRAAPAAPLRKVRQVPPQT